VSCRRRSKRICSRSPSPDEDTCIRARIDAFVEAKREFSRRFLQVGLGWLSRWIDVDSFRQIGGNGAGEQSFPSLIFRDSPASPEGMNMTRIFSQLLRDESGATAIEYGLIAALISVVIIAAVTLVGSNLSSVFNSIASSLQAA
jgi:pilus assembly protein Flp/PilA